MEDVDPQALAMLRLRAKRELRKRMRGLRKATPDAALAARSRSIGDRLLALPEIVAARAVALFWPIVERSEVDLRAVDRQLRAYGKRVYYPFMEGPRERPTVGFRRVDDATSMRDRGHGFLEPLDEAPLAARGDLDVIVVPALAVAPDGHRIGYGAGYYDRALPEHCPPTTSIVVAYAFQLLAEAPATDRDIPCDVVLTDVHHFEPGRA